MAPSTFRAYRHLKSVAMAAVRRPPINSEICGDRGLYSAISSSRSGLTKSFHDIVRLSWSTSVTPITYCGC
jgi:hypothetical protein